MPQAPMERAYFSIPHHETLTSHDGWNQHETNTDTFSIVRLHFLLRKSQLSGPHVGEIVSSFTATDGVSEEISKSIEVEHDVGLVHESVMQYFHEDTAITEFAAELSAKLGIFSAGSISMTEKESAKWGLRDSLTTTDKFQMTRTVKRKETFSRKWNTNGEKLRKNTTFVIAKGYRRCALDAYLINADHLTITYRKSFWGSKYTKVKTPRSEGGRPNPNVVKLGIPIRRMVFWEPLTDCLMTVPENDYKNAVSDPFDVEVTDLPDGQVPYAPIDPSPTLYELSNLAFPVKPHKKAA